MIYNATVFYPSTPL